MKLFVHATPNARTNEITGWEEDPRGNRVLKIRVAAQPVDGHANGVLRDYLAKALGLPLSKVTLRKGGSARQKVFEIPDGTPLP